MACRRVQNTLHFELNANTTQESSSEQTEQLESVIYFLQTIEKENEKFNTFLTMGVGSSNQERWRI